MSSNAYFDRVEKMLKDRGFTMETPRTLTELRTVVRSRTNDSEYKINSILWFIVEKGRELHSIEMAVVNMVYPDPG